MIAEKPSEELFAIDTTGSADIRNEYRKRNKPLKVDEILARRSAVPAVSSKKRLSDFSEEKRRVKARVSNKDYDRLRAIAYGGDAVQKDVVETGTAADHDPWAVQDAKEDARFSFLEKAKAKREPTTLKQAPVSLAKDGRAIPAVRKPAAGKSYNPNFDDWHALVTREGDKAVEAERKRLRDAREEAERLERAMAASESNDEAHESAWESEWEGFSEDDDSNLKTKRPERKTPAQRNRIKRRKAAASLAKHEARTKAKDRQALRIKELIESVAEKEKAQAALLAIELPAPQADNVSDDDDGDEILRKKPFGKHPYVRPHLHINHANANVGPVFPKPPSKSSCQTNSKTRSAV